MSDRAIAKVNKGPTLSGASNSATSVSTSLAMNRRLLKLAIIVVCIGIVVIVMYNWDARIRSNIMQISQDNAAYDTDSQQLQQTLNQMKQQGTLSNKVLSKEDFVNFLGNTVQSNGLTVLQYKQNGSQTSGQYTTNEYVIQVDGSLSNLSKYVNDIKNLGVCFEVQAVSLKKDDATLWDTQAQDTSVISWAKFDSNESDVVAKTEKITKAVLFHNDNYKLQLTLDFLSESGDD